MRLITYKYRIYPNKKQEIMFNKHIGCKRKVYNLLLDINNSYYNDNKKFLSRFELIKHIIPLKEEYTFLKDANSQTLVEAAINLRDALTRFTKKQNNYPKFKSKRNDRSFTIQQHFKLEVSTHYKTKLYAPKIGWIKLHYHRPIPEGSKLRKVTISKLVDGSWMASILIEDPTTLNKKKSNKRVGIDLGIKKYITFNDGSSIDNPKYYENDLNALSKLQSQLSKKQNKGFKGTKIKRKLNKLQLSITNKMEDFLHKVSNRIIEENQTIIIEDLDIQGLLTKYKSDKKLHRYIQYACWYKFRIFLTYKAKWYGRELIIADRYYASSKLCSNCYSKDDSITLKDRTYHCKQCGNEMDRDHNAAINLYNYNKV